MMKESVRLQYIKNVLGIKSVILPVPSLKNSAPESEFSFQTLNHGPILFLSCFSNESDKNFSIEELKLLEKIIIALKLDFQKTDIAKVRTSSKSKLLDNLKSKNYSYIFLMGKEISKFFDQKNDSKNNHEFIDSGIKFFATFHPQEMIKNPELKKETWAGFKSIMENLPRQ